MKDRELYKLAIEAVGECAPTATRMRNKLNKVLAQSDDPQLREMAKVLLERHQFASHSPAIPISKMSRCRDMAAALVAHCRQRLDQIGS